MSTNTDALKSNLGEAGTHLKQAASAAGEALKSAAVAAGDVADFNAALDEADAALYESKHAGRDRVTVHGR